MNENKDVAIISIEKYNALRDFKENVLAGHYVTIKNRFGSQEYFFFAKDTVIAELEKVNKAIVEENQKLIEVNQKFVADEKAKKRLVSDKLLYEFSRYSFREFLSWRKRFRSNFSDWKVKKF